MESIQHKDGRIELKSEALGEIENSPLFNEDLAPVPVAKRNWTTYNYAALVDLDGALHTDVYDGVGADLGGDELVAGTVHDLAWKRDRACSDLAQFASRHKIRDSVSGICRAAYGTMGSNLPALMRAIVACGWFGIQAWIGGQALQTFFAAFIPGWASLLGGPIGGHTPTEWLSFLIFWGLNILIIYRGMDLLQDCRELGRTVCTRDDGDLACVDLIPGRRDRVFVA